MTSSDSGWRICRVGIIILVATYAAIMLNVWFEVLRFTSEYANAVSFLLAQSLPFLALILCLWLGCRCKHRAILLLLLLLTTVSMLFGCLAFAGLKLGFLGTEADFEKIHSTTTGTAEVAVYRTNGGATTSYGVIVRHQKQILPRLLLVRRLLAAYPAVDASVVILKNNAVQITLDEPSPTPPLTFRLRRFVIW